MIPIWKTSASKAWIKQPWPGYDWLFSSPLPAASIPQGHCSDQNGAWTQPTPPHACTSDRAVLVLPTKFVGLVAATFQCPEDLHHTKNSPSLCDIQLNSSASSYSSGESIGEHPFKLWCSQGGGSKTFLGQALAASRKGAEQSKWKGGD